MCCVQPSLGLSTLYMSQLIMCNRSLYSIYHLLLFQAYFPTSTDSLMATGMMRDHNASNYPPSECVPPATFVVTLLLAADAKYGREIASPAGGTQAQQLPQAQHQQQGSLDWLKGCDNTLTP